MVVCWVDNLVEYWETMLVASKEKWLVDNLVVDWAVQKVDEWGARWAAKWVMSMVENLDKC